MSLYTRFHHPSHEEDLKSVFYKRHIIFFTKAISAYSVGAGGDGLTGFVERRCSEEEPRSSDGLGDNGSGKPLR